MKASNFLHGLLVLFLCFSTNLVKGKKGRGNKRCRCDQILRSVDDVVEKKLREFQDRLLNSVSLANDTSPSNIQLGLKLHNLESELRSTRLALQQETRALKYVQKTVHRLTSSVEGQADRNVVIEAVIRNLTLLVESVSGGNANAPTTPTVPSNIGDLSRYPSDCDEVYQKSGINFQGEYYIVVKPQEAPQPFRVRCRVYNNSGWTVIQRRQDGTVDFFRGWDDYKRGFGNLESEFWIGNDHIHYLTVNGDAELLIDMQAWNGDSFNAHYDHFKVSSEDDSYRLRVSGYKGNAGDSLTIMWKNHNGMRFSTFDKDNDRRFYDNCADHYKGGWWFNSCFDSHLNGRYYLKGDHLNRFVRNGILWNSIHMHSSLRFTEMMIKLNDRETNSYRRNLLPQR